MLRSSHDIAGRVFICPGRYTLWCLFALLLSLLSLPAAAQSVANGSAASLPGQLSPETSAQPSRSPAVHRVRSGDTLWGIAEQYFKDPQKWMFIQKANGITAPRRLKPGTLVDLEEGDAFPLSVLYLYGEAWQVSAGHKRALEQGATIKEGARIETGKGASLTLVTRDESQVVVPSNTRVVVKREGGLGIRLVLEKGEVDSRVSPRDNKNRPFNIETESGVLGVRGTRFVAEATDEATLSSVYAGSVAALQDKVESTILKAGEGARVGDDGSLDVVKLLSAPEILATTTHADKSLQVELQPPQRAAGFQATLSRDEKGLENIAVQRSHSPLLVFTGIPQGDYYLRVAAIDSLGVVGRKAQTAIEHRHKGVSVSHDGDAWRLSWFRQPTDRHALELATTSSFEKLLKRYTPFSTGPILLRQVPDRQIFWRVVTLDDRGDVASVIDSGRFDADR